MRILFVADGRSPIALNWIRHFVERGDEIYLASTFPCSTDLPLAGLEITPVAFSQTKRATSLPRPASARTLGLRTVLRHWLGPLTVFRASRRLSVLLQRVQPDLIHAMRIPYEGMLAADAGATAPLLVSIWGNDFTLHAPSTPLMSHYTRWTMQVAAALHADCQRDVRLARKWGFAPSKPSLVIPGNGGIRREVFFPPAVPVEAPIIVNPRGFRAYVRNDTFFQAIPLVLEQRPEARFLCPAMANEPEALRWLEKLHIAHAVQLLPALPHAQMAKIFRQAQIVISPSAHDGTPNSLLEGMACGCFPIAGDLESLREWITPGENGLLVDTNDPRSLAQAILTALQNKDLRAYAAGQNARIIASRADYATCMAQAEAFYQKIR
ncbi:MAG: glycosyltransferase family 4 protein [Anaerolineae bacterium]